MRDKMFFSHDEPTPAVRHHWIKPRQSTRDDAQINYSSRTSDSGLEILIKNVAEPFVRQVTSSLKRHGTLSQREQKQDPESETSNDSTSRLLYLFFNYTGKKYVSYIMRSLNAYRSYTRPIQNGLWQIIMNYFFSWTLQFFFYFNKF